MADPRDVIFQDCSNENTSSIDSEAIQMRSLLIPYPYAVEHIRKYHIPLYQNVGKPSDVLDLMRTLPQRDGIRNEFWKFFLIPNVPEEYKLTVMETLSNYTGDQLAHMADIVYSKIHGRPFNCPFISDTVSGLKFVIDSGCSHSVIPTPASEQHASSFLKKLGFSRGKNTEPRGIKELIVRLNMGRYLRWKFIVSDVNHPTIGADFLSYYDLLLDTKSQKLIDNQLKPTLFNEEHKDNNMCYDQSAVQNVRNKLLSQLEGHERPSEILRLMERLVPLEVIEDDIWKQFFLSRLPQLYQSVLGSKTVSSTIHELAFLADKIYKENHLETDHCLYAADRKSGLKFLVDSGSHLSQIPLMRKDLLTPIPLTRPSVGNSPLLTEYGQKNMTLDLGLNESFTWNFVMTNTGIPIIGADFLAYYELCIDLRRGKLIRIRPNLAAKLQSNGFFTSL